MLGGRLRAAPHGPKAKRWTRQRLRGAFLCHVGVTGVPVVISEREVNTKGKVADMDVEVNVVLGCKVLGSWPLCGRIVQVANCGDEAVMSTAAVWLELGKSGAVLLSLKNTHPAALSRGISAALADGMRRMLGYGYLRSLGAVEVPDSVAGEFVKEIECFEKACFPVVQAEYDRVNGVKQEEVLPSK